LNAVVQPGFQQLKSELIAFVELHQEVIGLRVVKFESPAIDTQKSRRNGDGGALVSIDEGVVLGKAL
jgi:hypothetical protein